MDGVPVTVILDKDIGAIVVDIGGAQYSLDRDAAAALIETIRGAVCAMGWAPSRQASRIPMPQPVTMPGPAGPITMSTENPPWGRRTR